MAAKFSILAKPTFTASVGIPVPGGEEVTVKFVFKHKGRKEIAEFFDELVKEGSSRTDAEVLGDLITGWEGIEEPFSKENLAALLDNYPASALTLLMAYRKELMEAKAKN